MPSPHRWRSVLFAPAHRPEVTGKLPRSGPDVGVIDLEDAVPADAKEEARGHAHSVADALAGDRSGPAVYVRVNAVASDWFAEDVARAVPPSAHGVVVPKLESAEAVAEVAAALDRHGLTDVGVLAGLETARGVAEARAVLSHPRVVAAYFGAEDFIADMGGVRTDEGLEVLHARSAVVLAARLAGVPAVDQVVTALRDQERYEADAAVARALGYAGKLCIHPAQVAWANDAFTPSPEEVDRARRLLAAAEAAAGAAFAFEGQMVDEPLLAQARALLTPGGA